MSLYSNHTNDPLAVIYNEGQWRLSKVTPLYNLQSNAVELKKYESKIRQAIATTVKESSSIKFAVIFEVLPYLKYSEDEPEGLMITVLLSRENLHSKLVYNSILLSWGVFNKVENAVHLPYMLECGEQKIGTIVKSTIETIFDCNISQFIFTQHQLLLFGFSFVDQDTSRSTDPFIICYTTEADHKNKLTLTFEIGDIRIIWNGIKEELSEYSERVLLPYKCLQKQIFHSVELNVAPLDLCEVKTPIAEANGTIKMKTPQMINCVFVVLNEICKFINGNIV